MTGISQLNLPVEHIADFNITKSALFGGQRTSTHKHNNILEMLITPHFLTYLELIIKEVLFIWVWSSESISERLNLLRD